MRNQVIKAAALLAIVVSTVATFVATQSAGSGIAIAAAVAVAALQTVLALLVLLSIQTRNEQRSLRNEHKALAHTVAKMSERVLYAPDFRATLLKILRQELITNYRQVEASAQLENKWGTNNISPMSRGWAASPDLMVAILSTIEARKPRVVVELGSGLSTLWIARIIEAGAPIRFISIDHDAHFAGKTMDYLRAQGLERHVELRICGLINQEWEGNQQVWYDTKALQDLPEIDLLIVDGPPRNGTDTYRWPAMWELDRKMAAHSTVIFDDAAREEEKKLGEAWAARSGYSYDYLPLEKGAIILSR